MSLINEVLQDLDQRAGSGEPRSALRVATSGLGGDGGSVSPRRDWSLRIYGYRIPGWLLVAAATLGGIVIGLRMESLDGISRSPGSQAVAPQVALPMPLAGAEPDSVSVIEVLRQPVSDGVGLNSAGPVVAPAVPLVGDGTAADVDTPVVSAAGLLAPDALHLPAPHRPASPKVQSTSDIVAEPAPNKPLVSEATPAEAGAAVSMAAEAVRVGSQSAAEPAFIELRNVVEPPVTAKARSSAAPIVPQSRFTAARPRLEQPLAEARQAIEQGELSVAEDLLQRRLGKVPQDRAARELLVGLMLRGERYSAALEQLDRGLVHFPGHAKFSLIKARLLAQSGDRTGALRLLESLPRSHAGRVEAIQMLGALYPQQGRYVNAVASYRELLGLKPNYGPAWIGLAISLDGTGDPAALRAYRQALRLGDVPSAAANYARERIVQLGAGRE